MNVDSSTPTAPKTTVVVRFTIDHPLWQDDGDDERLVVEALRHLLRRHVAFAKFEVEEVETS